MNVIKSVNFEKTLVGVSQSESPVTKIIGKGALFKICVNSSMAIVRATVQIYTVEPN